MSDTFQTATHHPDADQLSAFAEGVLPAHEREATLLHLAGCARCREVVSLALPAVEEAPEAATEPLRARKPWFADWSLAGWRFAWPPLAAGCAALLVFAVHMHNLRVSPETPAPQQTAAAHSPAPLPLPPAGEATSPPLAAKPAPPMPAPAPLAPPKIPPPPPPPAPVAMFGGAAPAGSTQGLAMSKSASVIDTKQMESLPLEGRNFQPLQQAQAGGGQGQAYIQGQSQLNAPLQNAAPSRAPVAAKLAPAPVQMAAVPPAVATPAPSRAAADTVEVNADAMQIDTVDAASVGSLASAGMHRLPSRLAVASAITRDRETLAIDTAGALFLSTDGGRHWKPVATPWTGRAARVTLASFAPQTAENYTLRSAGMAAAITLDGSVNDAAVSGALAKDAASTLSGIVTDPSGAVIPGALAMLTNTTGGASRTAKTNSAGRYVFSGVAPGSYKLTVSAAGFETAERGTFALGSALHEPLNLRLNVGAASETVTVETNNGSAGKVARKRAAAAAKAMAPTPLAPFEVTLTNGERWSSADGVSWSRR